MLTLEVRAFERVGERVDVARRTEGRTATCARAIVPGTKREWMVLPVKDENRAKVFPRVMLRCSWRHWNEMKQEG